MLFPVFKSNNTAEGNRFSVLATTPPTSTKPLSFLREFPAPTSRRTHNSRGTKEAKKRRDMRRNRRKFAAQLLDQHISQAVEETLTKASFPLPPQPPRKALLAPVTALRAEDAPLSQSVYLPLTPPELPMPDFSDFDMRAFPSFPTFTPLSLRTPSPFRTFPSWCPRIPSLTLGDIWRDSLPTFHDLSGLSEPTEVGAAMKKPVSELCRDVQIWRPIGSILGREQSKFFPPVKMLTADEQNDKKAKVKLPPAGCRLRQSEKGDLKSRSSESNDGVAHITQSSSPTEASAAILPERPHASLLSKLLRDNSRKLPCNTQSLEDKSLHLTSSSTPRRESFVRDSTSTHDLRHVFPWTQTCEHPVNDAALPSIELEDPSNRVLPKYHFAQPPYELEGREIVLPYVHANSLTGFSNESEDTVVHIHNRELPDIGDSTTSLPIMHLDDGNVGTNELVVDHDISGPVELDVAAGVPLPVSLPITPPATPPSQSMHDLASLIPISRVLEAEHRHSDAHFYGEQALFFQSPPWPTQSTDLPQNPKRCGSIDITDFLNLGHAKQCWCDHRDNASYPSMAQEDVQWASSPTLTDRILVNNDSALSLVLNTSESNFDSDSESEAPELLDLFKSDTKHAESENGKIEMAEDEDWLVFSHPEPAVLGNRRRTTLSSPLYLPSSPVLLRGRQQSPTIIVTTPSDTSMEDRLDEYVPVPPSTASMGTQTPAWHDMFPRRPSSGRGTGFVALSDEPMSHGFAKVAERSWRRASKSGDEWWDWAVEEEC